MRGGRCCSTRRIAAASIRAHSSTSSRLDLATLRRSEDSFVDELFAGVVDRGYPLMRAHFPRCYVDVNREPYELDPRMFDGRLPSFANTRSMRVAGGLGTVARVVGDAQEIYDQRISVDDALAADREPVQALSSRAAQTVHPHAPRLRRRHADRLPFDALGDGREGRPAARRHRARRPLRHELRRRRHRNGRGDVARRSATRSAATSPMPAASSPSITATRPPACTRSSSRSTARSTWTSSVTSAVATFARVCGRSGDAGRASGGDPAGGVAALSRGRRIALPPVALIGMAAMKLLHGNIERLRHATHRIRRSARSARKSSKPTKNKKKRPLAVASGPSLGRKRPRRAAGTCRSTLPRCSNMSSRCTKRKRSERRISRTIRAAGDGRADRGRRYKTRRR